MAAPMTRRPAFPALTLLALAARSALAQQQGNPSETDRRRATSQRRARRFDFEDTAVGAPPSDFTSGARCWPRPARTARTTAPRWPFWTTGRRVISISQCASDRPPAAWTKLPGWWFAARPAKLLHRPRQAVGGQGPPLPNRGRAPHPVRGRGREPIRKPRCRPEGDLRARRLLARCSS